MEKIALGKIIKSAKVERCGDRELPIMSITKKDGIVLQSEKFKKRIASKDASNYLVIPSGKLVQGIHIDEGNFGIQDIVSEGICECQRISLPPADEFVDHAASQIVCQVS